MATTAPLLTDLETHRLGIRFEECGDEELATLVTEASEEAFTVLYERHCQPLYRYCRSIVRDDLDAQDALQTAWTRALVALRHGRRDAPVRPWLYRIVHNEAVSVLRRRRRGPEPVAGVGDDAPSAGAAEGGPSAEDSAIARERFATVMADLGRLPERPRGALLMRELSGLSHEEIAAVLDTTVAAAKQSVYEARRDLADFAAGRETPCDDICRSISGGDRRVRRGRRVAAHLRDCPNCAAFASAIDDRRQSLHVMVPYLAVPAAITILDHVLRSGSGAGMAAAGGAGATGGAAGSSAAASGGAGVTGAGASVAGAASPIAAAGAAGQAAVAGGVVTKALGLSGLGKALVTAAAVTAGVATVSGVGGVGAVLHAAGRSAVVHHATPGARHSTSGSHALAVTPPGHARSVTVSHGRGQSHRAAAHSGASRGTAKSTAAKPGRRVAAGRASASVRPGQANRPAAGNATSATHAPVRAHGNGVAAGSSKPAPAAPSSAAAPSHGSGTSKASVQGASTAHAAVTHKTSTIAAGHATRRVNRNATAGANANARGKSPTATPPAAGPAVATTTTVATTPLGNSANSLSK